jgi:hypothetical protein
MLSAVTTIDMARRMNAFPANVVTPERERSNIGIPIQRFSFRIGRLSVDCSTSTRCSIEATVIRSCDRVP